MHLVNDNQYYPTFIQSNVNCKFYQVINFITYLLHHCLMFVIYLLQILLKNYKFCFEFKPFLNKIKINIDPAHESAGGKAIYNYCFI